MYYSPMELTLKLPVLQWARTRAGLERDALAERLKVSPDRVRRWERTGRIWFSEAEKLARVTRTPIGLLDLDEPPEEKLPVPDFRTIRREAVGHPNPDLLEVLFIAQARQDWFREYLLVGGAEPLAFVGSLTTRTPPREGAARIRSAVALDTNTRSRTGSSDSIASPDQVGGWEDALRLLVGQIEEQDTLSFCWSSAFRGIWWSASASIRKRHTCRWRMRCRRTAIDLAWRFAATGIIEQGGFWHDRI